MKLLKGLVRTLRPAQWVKNVILFAGLVFSQNFTNPELVVRASIAFVIFCMLSGSTYAFNDLWDLEQDKKHPVKCKRPLPSGMISPNAAVALWLVMMVLGLGIAWLKLGWFFGVLALGYVVLTLSYTMYIKHVEILDLLAVSGGFVIRAGAGAAAIPVHMSSWLFACTLLLSLFLVIGKRRAEITLLKEDAVHHRKVIAEYTPKLLDQMIAIVTSATLISYVLYTMAPETVARFQTDNLKFTAPFVLYGIFRYLYLIYSRDEGHQPERSLFTDWPLLVNLVLYAITVTGIIYFT